MRVLAMLVALLSVLLVCQELLLVGQEPLSSQLRDNETAERLAEERSAVITAIREAMQELDAQNVRRIGYRAKLIYAIREHRAVECTDLLLANLEEPEVGTGEPGPLMGRPAAQTLVLFGSPIYRELFERWIDRPRSKNQLLIVACVMVQIDGPRLATVRLEEAMEVRPNGFDYEGPVREKLPRTSNLRALLEYVKIDFSNPNTSPLEPRWSEK